MRAALPLVSLPRVLRRFVEASSFALGVAPECVATPALATCASAIGNTARIRLNATWSEPGVLWAVTLMESGSVKTPAYNAAALAGCPATSEETFANDQQAYRKAKQDSPPATRPASLFERHRRFHPSRLPISPKVVKH